MDDIYSRSGPELAYRFSGYANDGTLSSTEMFSIYCSEVDGYEIASIVDYCDEYINRDILPLVLLYL